MNQILEDRDIRLNGYRPLRETDDATDEFRSIEESLISAHEEVQTLKRRFGLLLVVSALFFLALLVVVVIPDTRVTVLSIISPDGGWWGGVFLIAAVGFALGGVSLISANGVARSEQIKKKARSIELKALNEVRIHLKRTTIEAGLIK